MLEFSPIVAGNVSCCTICIAWLPLTDGRLTDTWLGWSLFAWAPDGNETIWIFDGIETDVSELFVAETLGCCGTAENCLRTCANEVLALWKGTELLSEEVVIESIGPELFGFEANSVFAVFGLELLDEDEDDELNADIDGNICDLPKVCRLIVAPIWWIITVKLKLFQRQNSNRKSFRKEYTFVKYASRFNPSDRSRNVLEII